MSFPNIPSWIKSVFNEFPDHIYIKDENRRFVFANKSLAKAAKSNPEDLVGKRDEDLFTQVHLQKAIDEEQAMLSGDPHKKPTDSLELETWKDGRLTWVRTSKELILDDKGRPVGIFGISRSISIRSLNSALTSLVSGAPAAPSPNAGVYYQTWKDGEKNYKSFIYFDSTFLETFPGKRYTERFRHIHSSDLGKVLKFLKSALIAKQGFDDFIDFRVDKRSGNYHWIRGHAVKFKTGNVTHLIVSHHDISESKLRETLAAKLLASFPGFVFVKDEKGRFKFMNKPLLEFLGMNWDDLFDKTDQDLGFEENERAVFSNGDQSVIQGIKDPWISIGEKLTTNPGTDTSVTKTLVTIKMGINASVFNPQEKDFSVKHVLGISFDITSPWKEMSEAWDLWNALLNSSNDAVFVKNKQGLYSHANKHFSELTGLSISEILNKTTEEVWSKFPELIIELNNEDKIVFETGQALEDRTKDITLPDKRKSTRSTSKVPVRSVEGKIWSLLGISRDITKIQRADAFSKYLPQQLIHYVSNPPEPENKWVTVTFADIRGFSKLTGELQQHPESLVDLLLSFSHMVVDSADRHNCVLDKLMGDGAMILSGALTTAADEGTESARISVALAIDLQKRFPLVIRDWHNRNKRHLMRADYGIKLGVGIHVGRAIVGFFSTGNRDQFTAFGDVVNIAQRLESCAGKDNDTGIVISQPVYARIEGCFETKHLGDVIPPKETKPITAFSVKY